MSALAVARLCEHGPVRDRSGTPRHGAVSRNNTVIEIHRVPFTGQHRGGQATDRVVRAAKNGRVHRPADAIPLAACDYGACRVSDADVRHIDAFDEVVLAPANGRRHRVALDGIAVAAANERVCGADTVIGATRNGGITPQRMISKAGTDYSFLVCPVVTSTSHRSQFTGDQVEAAAADGPLTLSKYSIRRAAAYHANIAVRYDILRATSNDTGFRNIRSPRLDDTVCKAGANEGIPGGDQVRNTTDNRRPIGHNRIRTLR